MKCTHAWILGLAASLLLATTSNANTYFFDYETDTVLLGSGPFTASGSITVDTLGPVTTSNITDWGLEMSSGTNGTSVLTPLNSTLTFEGSVTATATDLEILLSDPSDPFGDDGGITFEGTANPGVDSIVFWLQTGLGLPNLIYFDNSPGGVSSIFNADLGSLDVGGPGAFSFAQIPEPTTAALLGLGGLAMLRRRRSA